MWDRLGLDKNKYEYVKLPACVTKILKREEGEHVLVSQILHMDNRDVAILNYITFENDIAISKAGYCCPLDKVPKDTPKNAVWVKLAMDIAKSWSRYAVEKPKTK